MYMYNDTDYKWVNTCTGTVTLTIGTCTCRVNTCTCTCMYSNIYYTHVGGLIIHMYMYV